MAFMSFSLLMSSCATKVPREGLSAPAKTKKVRSPKKVKIDFDQLQSRLNMNRAKTDLGFQEKPFDTCRVGSGFSTSKDCRTKRLSIIHFKLICRNSTGTVEYVSASDYRPVQASSVHWQVGLFKGLTLTDQEGYGAVRLVTPGTSKNQYIILRIGKRSLRLNAKEIRQVVVPSDWCS